MKISSLAAYLIPDVAFAAAVVALCYSLFLFPGYQKFFSDSDAGWHIRAGEHVLASHSLPDREQFSFTKPGAKWFAWEWLADVIVGTIHHGWGLSGVAFFYGCSISLGVWLWFRLNWLVGGDFVLACIFAAPMISSTTLHWLARPHLLSWLFLLGTVMFAEKLRRHPRITWHRCLVVVLLSCLWANIHGSFFFGALICLIYAAGIFLGRLLWVSADGKPVPYLVYAAISLVATLINPYGWNLHRHIIQYLGDSQLLSLIEEYQSFNFHAGGAVQVMIVLALAGLGGVLALVQKDLPVFFLSGFLIFAALHAARGLPIVALLLLPVANGAITKSLSLATGLRPSVAAKLSDFLAYTNRLRAIDAKVNGLVWAPLVMVLCLVFLRTPAIASNTGFPPAEFPVAASAAIDRLPASDRILSPDKFGGYLIYRFDGRRKVFFDGRSDLYGADFLKQFGRLMQARPGWQAILQPFRIDDALLPNDYPLISALEAAGWKPIYHDAVCTLLTRN